jgi:hypothetical protein
VSRLPALVGKINLAAADARIHRQLQIVPGHWPFGQAARGYSVKVCAARENAASANPK